MDGRYQQADYYKHTDETRAFQQEFEMAKQRQDRQLESIEKGLNTLRGVRMLEGGGGRFGGWGPGGALEP